MSLWIIEDVEELFYGFFIIVSDGGFYESPILPVGSLSDGLFYTDTDTDSYFSFNFLFFHQQQYKNIPTAIKATPPPAAPAIIPIGKY